MQFFKFLELFIANFSFVLLIADVLHCYWYEFEFQRFMKCTKQSHNKDCFTFGIHACYIDKN